jgi:hypothetical protein
MHKVKAKRGETVEASVRIILHKGYMKDVKIGCSTQKS